MKTALVLGGGSAKGAFQVGALKVILKKIIPDAVFGVSVGAWNGAFLLSQKDIWQGLEQLEELWLDATKPLFFPYNKKILMNFINVESIYSSKNMKIILDILIKNKKFKDLLLPFYVKCTRVRDGHEVYFNKGKVIEPVIASCSAPPMLPTVKIDGIDYMDGGFGGVGLKKAEDMGFDQIIFINLSSPIGNIPRKTIPIMFQCFIENAACAQLELEMETIKKSKVIEIKLSSKYSLTFEDFTKSKELIRHGRQKAREALKKIKL
jgi:NTE family protein